MPPFRVPLAIPDTLRVMITQPFGPTSNPLEPVGPNGEDHFHYGVDLVVGDDHHTYGVAIVCPFPTLSVVSRVWHGAMSGEGNGLEGYWTDEQGVEHSVVLWHCSQINVASVFKEAEVMAHVGNAGLVFPAPSLRDPYAGAHLHLGYRRNGVWTDPLSAFDIRRPYSGPAPTLALEMPPAEWVVQKILALMEPFRNQPTPMAPSNPPTP